MILIEELNGQIPALESMLGEAKDSLKPEELAAQLKDLDEKTAAPDFWNDQEEAQKVMKQKKSIESKINELDGLTNRLEDLAVMLEMAEEAEKGGDHEEAEMMAEEAKASKEKLESDLEDLKLRTLLDEKYDQNNAIISVHAGSGGTEAMDWAAMLLRMYTRWCEKRGFKADRKSVV